MYNQVKQYLDILDISFGIEKSISNNSLKSMGEFFLNNNISLQSPVGEGKVSLGLHRENFMNEPEISHEEINSLRQNF